PGDRERDGDVVAEVQRRQRALGVSSTYRDDANNARNKPEATHHQREDEPRDVMRDQVDRYAEDHRADVLGGGRLEEICAAAGAVADIVADQVRDDGRVARVVL